jgi:hypothetical protein
VVGFGKKARLNTGNSRTTVQAAAYIRKWTKSGGAIGLLNRVVLIVVLLVPTDGCVMLNMALKTDSGIVNFDARADHTEIQYCSR